MDIVYLIPWIPYMHHVVCIYALHMPIWQVNTFQLKEWFGIHKYMYYAHCAIHNGSKNVYKYRREGIYNRNPTQKTAWEFKHSLERYEEKGLGSLNRSA